MAFFLDSSYPCPLRQFSSFPLIQYLSVLLNQQGRGIWRLLYQPAPGKESGELQREGKGREVNHPERDEALVAASRSWDAVRLAREREEVQWVPLLSLYLRSSLLQMKDKLSAEWLKDWFLIRLLGLFFATEQNSPDHIHEISSTLPFFLCAWISCQSSYCLRPSLKTSFHSFLLVSNPFSSLRWVIPHTG